MGVTPNYPKFGAEWGVVATKPKFFVHFFDSRENYMRDIDKIAMKRY